MENEYFVQRILQARLWREGNFAGEILNNNLLNYLGTQ